MPTLIENQTPASSKFNSKFSDNPAEPRVLTKYDTKPYQNERSSILDSSFKSETSDSSTDDDLRLETTADIIESAHDRFEPRKYDGFQLKVLPSKDKILIRNKFTYLDPKSFSIVWHNIGLFIILHTLGLYGIYQAFVYRRGGAVAVSMVYGMIGGLGITAGGHRLWSHRSYKARLPLRIFLMIGQTIAGQNNLYVWCRDHRVHHKFSETDADPHNSLRGFFFAHMGWLLFKKHPDVFIRGDKVPMSDLKADPVIRFQIKYYYLLSAFFSFFLPTYTTVYLFNEDWWYAFLVTTMSRYLTSLHSTWFVNSAAHMFGQQPYNVNQRARENVFVAAGALGEGFHNYHHAFPSDYATSEMSTSLNPTKYFIELMHLIGQAYDLKRQPRSVVDAAMAKSLLKNEAKKLKAY